MQLYSYNRVEQSQRGNIILFTEIHRIDRTVPLQDYVCSVN